MGALRAEFRAEGRTLAISRDPLHLTPVLIQCEAFGTGGELIVVEEETGKIIIRQPIGRGPEEGDRARALE